MSIKSRIVNEWDFYVAFPCILILAFLVRSFGLNWDEGFFWSPHPDERAILFKLQDLSFPSIGELSVLLNPEQSPLNPQWFAYGSAPMYLMKLGEYIFSYFHGSPLDDLRILGRFLSSLADLGTIIFSFLLARKLIQSKWAILVPFLIAITVIHIQLSSFLTVDTFATFFTVTTIYFLHRVATSCIWSDSILAGIFLGIGLATKISLLPLGSVFIVAHLFYLLHPQHFSGDLLSLSSRTSQVFKGLFLGAVATAIAFLIAQPYALLDYSQFLADLREQSLMVRGLVDYPYTRQYFDTVPYFYHLKQLSIWGLGIPLAILVWSGLTFVLCRGLTIKHSLVYLLFGLILPASILVIFGNNFITIFCAAGISLLFLLLTVFFRSYESRLAVISLCWVIPYILIWGCFEVKFMRYFLPVIPFLVIYGALLCNYIGGRISRNFSTRSASLVVIVLLLIVLGSTVIYTTAYINMRSQTHSAVDASKWLQEHSDITTIVLREHWDEGLPLLRKPLQIQLPMYDSDSPAKTKLISDSLEKADYLVIYSNRLYGTIARLPDRYPVSRAYYENLFNENLGYQLVHFESHRPHFGPFEFLDDTWSRPGIKPPTELEQQQYSPVSISMGYADESFTVYTNPKVMIFRNTGRFSTTEIQGRILSDSPSYPNFPSLGINLMFDQNLLGLQRNGGTFSEIFDTRSWVNQFPVLVWLLFIQLLMVVGLPISFLLFPSLSDKGWLLAKPLGLLILGFSVWILCSFQLIEFSRVAIFYVFLALILLSIFLIVRFWDYFSKILFQKWKLFLTFESLYLIAFLGFVFIRMLNPDLWHPFRGGEKPMDFAYFNAVIKSTTMPPYDPWLSGGHMNYYYYGHFLSAMVTKATGILPEIAYNLAVPLFFSLTFSAVISVGFNLCEWMRISDSKLVNSPKFFSVLAGLLGAFFVCVFGNLDGLLQLIGNIFTNDRALLEFDYWSSSRMMPSSVEGITEFPFFTFLFADLHAHLMALPFAVLSIGISLSIIQQNSTSAVSAFSNFKVIEFGRLTIVSLVLGSLFITNAWDFPTQMFIFSISVLISEYIKLNAFNLKLLIQGSWKIVMVAILSILLFLPYHQHYEAFFNGVTRTTHTTDFWRIAAIFGFFLLLMSSLYVSVTYTIVKNFTGKILNWHAGNNNRKRSKFYIYLMLMFLAIDFGLVFLYFYFGLTFVLMALLSILVAYLSIRFLKSLDSRSGILGFLGLLSFASTSLILGLEIFRVEGDIGRMNSIFKFYLQIWVLLGIVSSFAMWMLAIKVFTKKMSRLWSGFWIISISLGIFVSLIYPVLGTQHRINDRFESSVGAELTLNGLDFADRALFWDSDRPIYLAPDIGAAKWMRANVFGSPVILEAVTPQYLWGSRMSIFTGLPTVVGWEWHQSQQRWAYKSKVEKRVNDVRTIYTTVNMEEARELLEHYDVTFIIVGELERIYYQGIGLSKFENLDADWLDLVYDVGGTRIYRYQ